MGDFTAIAPNLFTRREREIISLVSRGLTPRQISVRLYLSINTVYAHLRNIAVKFNNVALPDPLVLDTEAILSPREALIFQMICDGNCPKCIAEELSIQPKTVYNYLELIKLKLNLSTSLGLKFSQTFSLNGDLPQKNT